MKQKTTAVVFIAIFLSISGYYLSRTNNQIQSLLFLLPPLIASIMGFYAANTYKLENIHGRSMALFGSGLGFFFIGETLFYLYQYVFERTPFPSIADVFYLLAYLLLLWGLLIEVRMHKPKLSEFNKQTMIVMLAVLLAVVGVVSYFGIYKAYDSSSTAAANIIAMGYGVMDLIILVPAMYILKLAFDFKGGKLFNSWIMIFFAIIFMLAGDILFASYNGQYSDGTWPYSLIDLLWTASYLLFGFSFYYTASVLNDLRGQLLQKKQTK